MRLLRGRSEDRSMFMYTNGILQYGKRIDLNQYIIQLPLFGDQHIVLFRSSKKPYIRKMWLMTLLLSPFILISYVADMFVSYLVGALDAYDNITKVYDREALIFNIINVSLIIILMIKLFL